MSNLSLRASLAATAVAIGTLSGCTTMETEMNSTTEGFIQIANKTTAVPGAVYPSMEACQKDGQAKFDKYGKDQYQQLSKQHFESVKKQYPGETVNVSMIQAAWLCKSRHLASWDSFVANPESTLKEKTPTVYRIYSK